MGLGHPLTTGTAGAGGTLSPTAGSPGQPQLSAEGLIGAGVVGGGVGTGVGAGVVGTGVGAGVGAGVGTGVTAGVGAGVCGGAGPMNGRPGQPQSVEASVPMLQVTTQAQRARRRATPVAMPCGVEGGLRLPGSPNRRPLSEHGPTATPCIEGHFLLAAALPCGQSASRKPGFCHKATPQVGMADM
mmetsp:Transcript_41798/g.76960  ORF Transcript_41798/g.76960 Transcript_41798/m.76960 type:complete len:186 (+) Transcript_41798:110-667(+)